MTGFPPFIKIESFAHSMGEVLLISFFAILSFAYLAQVAVFR